MLGDFGKLFGEFCELFAVAYKAFSIWYGELKFKTGEGVQFLSRALHVTAPLRRVHFN